MQKNILHYLKRESNVFALANQNLEPQWTASPHRSLRAFDSNIIRPVTRGAQWGRSPA